MAELRWGIATDPGQVRPENEDHVFAVPSLFVVADGMGGHQAGEIASQLAVQRLESRLTDDTPTIQDLVTAIGDANQDIYNAALANPEQQGMGTTITSMAVMSDPHDGEVFALANVGDSRTYLFRHGRLRQLTVDHSYVQELVSEGHISRDEARNHPRRNIVTRALGIESVVRVDSWTVPIIRGDRFLLCSDGLVDEVHDDDIAALLASVDDPQTAADDLVRMANESGGRDNISVVVVDVLDGDDPPDPTQEFDAVPAWSGDIQPETPAGDSAASTGPTGATAGATVSTGAGLAAEAAVDESDVITSARVLYDGADDIPGDQPGVTDQATNGAAPTTTGEQVPRGRRKGRLVRFLVTVGVATVVVLGFTIFAAWARDGFFVAFDDTDQVVIFRGRSGGVLWFDPTVELPTAFDRATLDSNSISKVEDEPRFSSLRSAESFVRDGLETTTTTTTTTTTIPPAATTTTVAPATARDVDGATATGTTAG